jgi:microcystin-dependent protein
MDFYLGTIILWASARIPDGWVPCDGRLLKISSSPQNQALYSLIGNAYGGTSNDTFALPNLNGHAALGSGPSFQLGQNISGVAGSIPPGSGPTSPPGLVLTYIICVSGNYPPFSQ